MGVLDEFQMRRAARRDAEVGLDAVEDRLTSQIGLKPVLNPVGRHDHAQVVADLQRRGEIEEMGEDLRRAEEAATPHTAPWKLFVALIFITLVEVKGAIDVMRSTDVPEGDRLARGLALALGLIVATVIAAKVTEEHRGPEGAEPKARLASFVVPAIYSVLIAALVALRLAQADDDATRTELYSQAVVMTFCTVGPAWGAHFLIARYLRSRLIARERNLLRQRIGGADKARQRASRVAERLSRDAARWDQKAARLRAAYEVERRLALAHQGAPQNKTTEEE